MYVEDLAGVVCGEKIGNPGYFVAVGGNSLFPQFIGDFVQ